MASQFESPEASLLHSILNPSTNCIVPPTDSSRASVLKEFTVYGNFPITVDSKPSGIILWHPLRGITSLTRCCFVEIGEDISAGPFTITANKKFIIPFEYAANIQISPPISVFSLQRPVSGAISIGSNSTSTTTAALSGELSYGCPTDTRSIMDGSPSGLAQQSIPKKDGGVGIPISSGVTMIQGPDFLPGFIPGQSNGTTDINKSALFQTRFSATDGFTYFVSPWSTLSGPPSIVNIPVDAPAIYEPPIIECVGFANGGQTGNFQFTDLFIARDSTCNFIFVTNVQIYDAGPFKHQCTVPSATVDPHLWQWYGTGIVSALTAPVDFNYYVTETGRNGVLGPTRWARFDNVAVGQNIIVSGKMVSECIPTGSFGPYMTPVHRRLGDSAIIATLSDLFASTTSRLSRILPGDLFAELKRLSADNEGLEDLLSGTYKRPRLL